MSRKSQGIRARRIPNDIIELWLGEPGYAESECILAVSEFYIPGILHTLENIRKAPSVEHPKYHQSHD